MNELEETIKALRRADHIFAIASRKMHENNIRHEVIILLHGEEQAIIEAIATAMYDNNQVAECITAATHLFVKRQGT